MVAIQTGVAVAGAVEVDMAIVVSKISFQSALTAVQTRLDSELGLYNIMKCLC